MQHLRLRTVQLSEDLREGRPASLLHAVTLCTLQRPMSCEVSLSQQGVTGLSVSLLRAVTLSLPHAVMLCRPVTRGAFSTGSERGLR